MGPIVAQVYIELSYENGMVAMVTDMVPRWLLQVLYPPQKFER
jgi:hypothetical protein